MSDEYEMMNILMALKPFAKVAEVYDARESADNEVVHVWASHQVDKGKDIRITVGDLRRCKKILDQWGPLL